MKKIFSLFLSLIICLSFINISSFSVSAAPAVKVIADGAIIYLKNVATGKYMQAAGSTSGSNIYQNSFSGNVSQQFKLKLVEGSGATAYYNIIPMNNTSLRLDIDNMATANGTNVKVFNESTSYPSAQRFRFTSNGDGSYRIIPKSSASSSPNEVIEVAGPYTADYTNIQIWDYVGGSGQKWIVESSWIYMYKTPKYTTTLSSTHNFGVHNGIDLITNPLDTIISYPIYAATSGKILYIGGSTTSSTGYFMTVAYNDGYTARYLHLNSLPTAYKKDDTVERGAEICYTGKSGNNSNGQPYLPHLHHDINTIGTYSGTDMTSSNTVNPVLFYPTVNFN